MFHARVAATTEMSAGLGLALGLLTPIPAAGFVALMFVAAWTVHRQERLLHRQGGLGVQPDPRGRGRRHRRHRRGHGSAWTTRCSHGTRALRLPARLGRPADRRRARPGRRHRPAGDLLPPAGPQAEGLREQTSRCRDTPCSGQFASARAGKVTQHDLEHVLVWPAWDFSSRTCPSSTSPNGARAPAPRGSARWPGTGPRSGFGTPVVLHLFYVVKILLYVLGGVADRARHHGDRRLHQRGVLVRRADRVPEGRAVHDAVRGRRPRLRLRAAEQPVLPADGFDPVLVAAQDHSAATVAGPRPADPGRRPRTPFDVAALRARCW